MKKILLAVIITVLLMLYVFYVGLIHAKVVGFDNGYGQTIVYVEIYGFRFNYLYE